MAEFFVIIAGRSNEPDSEIVLLAAATAEQAHRGAATEYRRKRGLAPNVHVRTATAHRCDNEAEATLFTVRLVEKVDAAAEAST